ncbi:uncharacterized protein KQ657_004990 [Scheffersomyces spartinae]|uniref:thioredoxin-dependent peroxiredoxin n=1 Tax=Scheffersomyces spartinae TaxID=45513 RepID=A0A9P8AID5_9ASCO|nr:uncharacterized protein KQ657_004990 [Scheffersomyces spartinae]KAG7194263.1 hypothetical protein KQ657_004990 [Scheffersomyces spartinae]
MPELRRSTRVANAAAATATSTKNAVVNSEPPKKKAKKAADNSEQVSSSSSTELQVGDKIPELTLLDENENEINLAEAASNSKYLVIFAYPKALTPGCTRQVCGFQKNYQFFQDNKVTVFGLSSDTPKAQMNFVTKQHLEYPLLSDPGKKLIGVLGAKKSPSGIKRSHWIFVDGVLKVKKIQISPEASIETAKLDVETFISEDDGVKEEPKEEPKEESKEEEPKKESVSESAPESNPKTE